MIWSTFFGGSATDSITSLNVASDGGIYIAGQAGSSDLPGLVDAPAGCRPSSIQKLSFAARLTPDGTSASPAQLSYGAPTYTYGVSNSTGPVAVASPTFGTVVALEKTGSITTANLFATGRLACLTDPADNVQLSSVAPGQDLTIFGATLAQLRIEPGETGPNPSPVNVTFNGISAPILYTSDNQINVQVPAAIAGQATVLMEVTNPQSDIALDGSRTLTVVPQQPSVFLTQEALAGSTSCAGYGTAVPDTPPPAAVALNADDSLNSPDNPAAVGSTVTIFLNGVTSGEALTGVANDTPITLAPSGSDGGVLPASFQIPPSATNGVTLTKLQAGGVAVRETAVAFCVIAGGQ